MKKVLIINFHELCKSKVVDKNLKQVYSIQVDTFTAILDFITKSNIPVISLNDFIANSVNEKYAIAITFDDGNASDYSLAYPILNSYCLPATFFLTVNQINENHISWENVIEMSKNKNITFGSHGVSHNRLTKLNTEEKEYELLFSKQFIENKIKKTIDFFSLPYGDYDKSIIDKSRRTGYKAIFTTDVRINNPELSPYVVHRWSPKSNISVEMLKKMITFNTLTLKQKIWTSRFKKMSKTILGDALSDKLNLIYHK